MYGEMELLIYDVHNTFSEFQLHYEECGQTYIFLEMNFPGFLTFAASLEYQVAVVTSVTPGCRHWYSPAPYVVAATRRTCRTSPSYRHFRFPRRSSVLPTSCPFAARSGGERCERMPAVCWWGGCSEAHRDCPSLYRCEVMPEGSVKVRCEEWFRRHKYCSLW